MIPDTEGQYWSEDQQGWHFKGENTVWAEFWLAAALVALVVFGLGLVCGMALHG